MIVSYGLDILLLAALNYISFMTENNQLETSIGRDQIKHVQKDVDFMRNKVQVLRNQLQKEKDSIAKHKSLTEDMIRKKL